MQGRVHQSWRRNLEPGGGLSLQQSSVRCALKVAESGQPTFTARSNHDALKAGSGRWLRPKMKPSCKHYRRPMRKNDAIRAVKRNLRTSGFRWFAGVAEKAASPTNRHCTKAPMNGQHNRKSCRSAKVHARQSERASLTSQFRLVINGKKG